MTGPRHRLGRRGFRRDATAIATETQVNWQPTHRELEQLLIDIARGNGWLVHVIHDSREQHWAATSGWPDVVLVKAGRLLAFELKIPPDDVRDDQRAWLTALDAVPGIDAHVMRPTGRGYTADLLAITQILRNTGRVFGEPT